MPARASISESLLGENASSRRVDGVGARIQPRRDDVIHALRDAHARDDDAFQLGLERFELRRHLQR